MTGWEVPHLMSAKEVAERIRVKPSTVANLRRNGKLQGVLIGKAFMFDPADVLAFIERQKEEKYAAPASLHPIR